MNFSNSAYKDEVYSVLTCCLWQIYGLKTLVKSLLPRHRQVVRKIDDLLIILSKTLKSQGHDGIKSWYVLWDSYANQSCCTGF